jgi:hypothetical protein
MARDAFPGYDEPVNIDMEPEEALRLLVDAEDKDKTEAEDQGPE